MKIVDIIPLTYKEILTYSVPQDVEPEIKIGQKVLIPFGKKETEGIILSENNNRPKFKLRKIISIINKKPLLTKLQADLINHISNYYFSSTYQAFRNVLPENMQNVLINSINYPLRTKSGQKLVLIKKNPYKVFTKSAIKTLKSKKQVLIVFPTQAELNDFCQIEKDLIDKYSTGIFTGKIDVQSKKEIWRKINSGKINLALGTRISLFLPFKNLGLIIISQDYRKSLRSEKTPKYDSKEIAEFIQEKTGCFLILQSEMLYWENYYKLKGEYLRINSSDNKKAKVSILQEPLYPIIGTAIQTLIQEKLSENKKIALFINQKGKFTASFCLDCQEIARCPECSKPLRPKNKTLICQDCRHEEPQTIKCKNCQGTKMIKIGVGADNIKEEVEKIFPTTKTNIIDSETVKRMDRKDLENAQIYIGTESLKNINLTKIELLFIMYPENIFNLNTQSNLLKAHSLLSSLTANLKDNATVLVKTAEKNNPVTKALISDKNEAFLEKELKHLNKFKYPPFYDLIKISVYDKNLKNLDLKTEKIKDHFRNQETSLIKQKNNRVDLIIKSKKGAIFYDTMLREIRDIKIERNPDSIM